MNEREYDDDFENEFPSQTPLWWVVLWFVWGAIVSITIYALDREVVSSGLWATLAGLIATFTYRPCRSIIFGLLDYYYDDHQQSPEQIHDRYLLVKLCVDYQRHADHPNTEDLDSALYHEILQQYRKHPNCPQFESFAETPLWQIDAFVPMSMFGGVLHGFLAGGVLGTLSNLDGSVGEVSAITLAAWGCIIGALGLSILYGCLMVVLTFTMFPHDKSERWMVTIKRRLLLLFSPVWAIAHILRTPAPTK